MPTKDGGYIIAANTVNDVLLFKTNAIGTPEWGALFGGSGFEFARCVQQTSDGGYVIAGYTNSFGAGSYDVYLVKVDSAGGLEWENAYGGRADDFGWSVVETADRGYMLAGGTEDACTTRGGDILVIKTTSDGTLEWKKTIGGNRHDFGSGICQSPDGDCILCGKITTDDTRESRVYLSKIDIHGNLRWEKVLGTEPEEGYCVQPSREGGYIISGKKNDDVLVVKTDGVGNVQWESSFPDEWIESGSAVIQAWDGGYMVVGTLIPYTDIEPDTAKLFMIRVDERGNMRWKEDLAWDYQQAHGASSIAPSSDGGFIVVGSILRAPHADYDVLLMKLLPEGIQYDFDTGSEGWDFGGNVANLDQPSSTALGGHIGLSPDGSASSFSYWQSPGVFIERGKAYRARSTAGTNAEDLNRAPDFRICANAENTWQYWDTGVCTFDTGSTKSVELFMLPELQATSGTMAVNLDLTSFDPQDDLSSWIYLENVRLDIIHVTSSSTELVRFTFDTGAEGWQYAGRIAGFDEPSSAAVSGRLGLSPAGSAHCFSYWNSPPIGLAPGKIYQVCWTVESDLSNPNRAPEIRLRADQPSSWRSWEMGLPSCGGISPSFGFPKTFGMIIQPDGDATTQTLHLSFDLLNFDPADEAHSWVYLDEVAVREVTIAP